MKNTNYALIEEIVKNYELSKKESNFLNKYIKDKNYQFYRDFEIAFYSLNPKERTCFYNEFLVSNKLWWNPFYTKDEYLQTKSVVCEKFLNRFYEIR